MSRPVSTNLRISRRALAGRTAALLAAGGLTFWFAAKFALPSASGVLEIAVGLAALTGLVGAIALLAGPYGRLARAKAERLDERQLTQRDRAYRTAFGALAALTFAGWIAGEMAVSPGDRTVSPAVVRNFLFLVFVAALIAPAALLAFGDHDDDDED